MTFADLVEDLEEELHTHPEWANLETYFVDSPNDKAMILISISEADDGESLWIDLGEVREVKGIPPGIFRGEK